MTERDGGFSEPVGGRGRDGPHHPEQEERSRVESLLPISSQALRMTGWGGGYGSGAVVEYCAIAEPGFLNKKFRNDTFLLFGDRFVTWLVKCSRRTEARVPLLSGMVR